MKMCFLNQKLFILKLVILLLCFSQFSEAKKSKKRSVYCKLPHCEEHNLACSAKMNFSAHCTPGIKLINLKPHEDQILHLLNTYRNKVALGYTRTLFPAARMARMSWSKELEKFANLYIMKCSPEMNPCMSSPEFTNIGSIYDGITFQGVYKPSRVPELVKEVISEWFEDTRYVTRSMLMQLTNNFRTKSVRRAVLLMADRNSHVGCSGATYVLDYVNHFRLVCTFATDNMNDIPIYKVSSNPGKECKRRDNTYKNLCAFGENYNNNHEYQAGELLMEADDIFTVY